MVAMNGHNFKWFNRTCMFSKELKEAIEFSAAERKDIIKKRYHKGTSYRKYLVVFCLFC